MKKLLSLIALAACLLIAPSKAHATGGCFLYWQCNPVFFLLGGSVYVQHPDGSGYTVDYLSYNPRACYGVQNGSRIYAFRPAQHDNCAAETWGASWFCACNSSGGVDCAPSSSSLTLADNALYEIYQGYVNCGCPTGASYGGISPITIVQCSTKAPPPPPQ